MPRAKNTVLPTSIRSETHVGDLPLAQPPDVTQRADGTFDRGEAAVVVDKPLNKDYLDALAFAEDALTIRIEPSDEENAPLVVDCWVNGKGAEVKDTLTGRWMEINCLPIGQPIVTKRKYVEVLARSRVDRVKTTEENSRPNAGEDGWKLKRSAHRKSLFSVIHDPSPMGPDWLTRLYAERA